MARVSDITRAEWEALRADGIEPTLEETADLIEWGRRTSEPHGRANPIIDDLPVDIGGVRLYPMTMAGEAWIDAMLPTFSREWKPVAIAWACAHGRDLAALRESATPAKAVAAVGLWAASVTATRDALYDAAERMQPEPEPRIESNRKPIDMEAIYAQLHVATGRPREYWLRQAPGNVLAVVKALPILSGESPDYDDSATAQRKLLAVVERIRERAGVPAQ